MKINKDAKELLSCFEKERVEYVIIGAHALAAHGVVRFTGDIDILVLANKVNAEKVYRALLRFGAPVLAHGINEAYFAKE